MKVSVWVVVINRVRVWVRFMVGVRMKCQYKQPQETYVVEVYFFFLKIDKEEI